MTQQLALIRETLAGLNQSGLNQASVSQTNPANINQASIHQASIIPFGTDRAGPAEAALAAPAVAAPVPVEPSEPEPVRQAVLPFMPPSEPALSFEIKPSVETPMADTVTAEDPVATEDVESDGGVLGELGPLALASVPAEAESEETAFAAEIASVEDPVSDKMEEPVAEAVAGEMTEREPQKEVLDFIAHARRAAQGAALAEQAKPRSSLNMRWLAWGSAAVMVLLICAAMVMAAGAINGGAHGMMPTATARPMPQAAAANSGTTRRQAADKGVAHLLALADSGDARAETALALAYLKGDGVAGDDEAARRWSEAAAAQGQPVAEYVLGTLYLEGNRNESEAARWFLASAAQGNIKAMHNLAIAYAEGQGVEKDPAEAVKWFLRAAEAGYRDSQFDLGVVYERGLGVPQSARAALKWYLIAAGHGDMPSATRAQTLRGQMDPGEVKAASEDAASFAPQEASLSANQAPVL
jgi:localization factor PodJL